MDEKKKDKKLTPTPPKIPGFFMVMVISLSVFMLLQMFWSMLFRSEPPERIYFSQFVEYLEEGRVEKVVARADRIMITLHPDEEEYGEEEEAEPAAPDFADWLRSVFAPILNETEEQSGFAGVLRPALISMLGEPDEETGRTVYTARFGDNNGLRAMLMEHNSTLDEDERIVYYAEIVTTNWIQLIFFQVVMPILIIVVMILMFRRMFGSMMGGKGGIMGFGQSNAKVYMEKKTGVTFEDVAGQGEAKESLTEIVDFLHNPEKYTEIGATQPKGALLVGPPGTGKTLLAKAVAGEAGVVFFSLSGSDFVEMFVGVGASRVRDLFKQANSQSPCIIFIDEIDAIGRSRDGQMSGNDEREQTLNQLLAEMDGFDSSKGVVILGATNRPEILDKALLRPGRFDRRINVELPDLKGRIDILNVHAKKVKMSESTDLSRIAAITPGAAGADLANMINEAALNAVRMKRKEVAQEDLLEAVEVVIAGKEKKDRIMTEKEKRIVAYHEVGHALARTVQKDAKPVEKITIVPRTKGSLGYVLSAPEEEKYMHSKDEMLAEIIVLMAGRAAEEVQFDTKTTGASNDIEKATQMARSMVSMYGMSEKFGMMGLESVQNRYLDGRAVLNVSDQTGAELDAEVRSIIDDCYQKAISLLKDNEHKLNEIAEYLFNKETITGEEFMELYNNENRGEDLEVSTPEPPQTF
ncbi:MAG: ATP-dependent zinc metalloprotease FtsH [Defluviitaleaceae bacterium]|nr:ATP-dependent zinc metalloprotease FtsH [Defluviitaleaceae bacterium]MCL2263526.1 ATP-dependent zinc metalloprotease FtsH [Defluviitaleaceae bacterium]